MERPCAPNGGQSRPSWFQERLQGAQDEPKMAPTEAQNGPKRDTMEHRKTPKRPKIIQKEVKEKAREMNKLQKYEIVNC